MVVKPDTYTEQQAKGSSVKNVEEIVQVEEQFIETFEFEDGAHTNVKGNLKKSLTFWEAIGISKFILETIDEGYKLPFTELPNRVYLRNNKSAEADRDFVNEAILDLVNSGRVCESIAPPYVVNSLSVSVQSNIGKKQLILYLRQVNKCLSKKRVKYEDWKIALSYFERDAYMFTFDLNSRVIFGPG